MERLKQEVLSLLVTQSDEASIQVIGDSALVYSISGTTKLNNLRPYCYFRCIRTELPKYCDEKGNIDPPKRDQLKPWAEEIPEGCRKLRRS